MAKRPQTRAETKQATREALIAAGLEEFGREGLDASLDAICARAKLTRGAFYVHFADREALIVVVMEHVLGTFMDVLTGAAASSVTISQAVKLFFAAAQARSPAVHGGRGLRFFHLMDACHRSKQVGEAYRRLVVDGRDRIAANIATDRAIRADIAPEALADFMTVMALGVVALYELELPIDVPRLGRTALVAITPTS